MSRTVFVLGAGASKQAGVPLMGEFLDVAEHIWRSGELNEQDTEHFERVFRAISKLQIVHSKSKLDLVNLEAVFSTFEMAKLLGKLPGFEEAELSDLITSMKRVIVVTIEKTLEFPFSSKRAREALPYGAFCNLLKEIRDNSMEKPGVSIVTFNYDIALDHALHINRLGPNYHLMGHAESKESVSLLKLHGSINWGSSSDYDQIIPYDLHKYFKNYSFDRIFSDVSSVKIPIGTHLNEQKDSLKIDGEPVIVPPTWNKSLNHSELSKVWSQAAIELEEAENILVIGFSLPETDMFFKHLYALGTVGDLTLKKFWVFDPDESGSVKKRYENMLGSGALRRFDYQPLTFEDAIPFIREALTGLSSSNLFITSV